MYHLLTIYNTPYSILVHTSTGIMYLILHMVFLLFLLLLLFLSLLLLLLAKKNHIGKLVYVSHMIGHWKKCVWSICSLSLMELLKAFVLQSAKIRHLKDTLIPIPILRPLFEELIEGSWYMGWRRRQNWPYKVSKVYHPRA